MSSQVQSDDKISPKYEADQKTRKHNFSLIDTSNDQFPRPQLLCISNEIL